MLRLPSWCKNKGSSIGESWADGGVLSVVGTNEEVVEDIDDKKKALTRWKEKKIWEKIQRETSKRKPNPRLEFGKISRNWERILES